MKQFLDEGESKIIIGLEWDENSRYSNVKRGKPKGLEDLKLPIIIKNVFSRGKLIILECEYFQKDYDYYIKDRKIFIIFHLGMTGDFDCGKENKRKHSNLWITLGKESEEYKGYYIETSRFYFTDSRKFGSCSIHKNLDNLFKKNGPCLMSAALIKYKEYQSCNNEHIANEEIWNKTISNKKIQNKPICEFMLEQKYVSGIGNYLRAEILYRAKIHPERKLKDLNEEERKRLYNLTLDVIYEAWITKGPSNGYIKGGHFKLEVYSRSKDSLGNDVYTYSDSKKRTVHYVPEIQK